MNIFVQFKDEVATPALTGSILPGVTRMSVLQILRDWGYNVTERLISIREIMESSKSGNLIEIFGKSTLGYARNRYTTNGDVDRAGRQQQVILAIRDKVIQPANFLSLISHAPTLYNELSGIQSGKIADRHGWLEYLES